MISPPKARILSECFFRVPSDQSVVHPLDWEWRGDQIEDCIDSNNLNNDYITQLLADSILIDEQQKYCNRCGTRGEICEFPDQHTHEIQHHYQLQENPLINEWIEWVRNEGIFRTISEPERVRSGHWSIDADFQNSEVTFQVFLDADLLREHSFQPKELEFGISFSSISAIPDEEHLFGWYEPLDRPESGEQGRFERDLGQLIEEYEDAITARIVSENAVESFAREIRSGIWKSLDERGFETSTEISRCDGYRQYRIDPREDDFVAIHDSDGVRKDLLFCRCSKGNNSIHFHLFKNGTVVSPEDDETIGEIIPAISDKVDKYRRIRAQQRNISRLMQVVSALAAVVPILFIVNFVFDVVGILGDIFPSSWDTTAVLSLLVVANLLLVIVLVILMVLPYLRLRWFDWSISSEDRRFSLL